MSYKKRKARSQERIQRWPNSINAYKHRKDHTRFDRFRQDEEDRRQVDRDEAVY